MNTVRTSAAVAALAVVTWLPSLGVGFVTDDFDLLVQAAPGVRGFLGALRSGPQFWRPATDLLFWVEHESWGARAPWFHLVNVVLHAVNATLILILARRLGLAPRAAGVAAAWFAVNPAAVGAVAWIAGQATLLATAFTLLAAVAASGSSALLPSLCLALALLSKETGIAALGWILTIGVSLDRRPFDARTALCLALCPVYLLLHAYRVGFQSYAPAFGLDMPGLGRFVTSLAFPLTDAVYANTGVTGLATTTAVVAIVAGLLVQRGRRPTATALVLLVCSLAPVTMLLGGPPSLYHSRHYYMPSAAVALLVGLALDGLAGRVSLPVRRVAAAGTCAGLFALAQLDIGHWARNGRLALTVAEAAGDAAAGTHGPLYVTGYPDMQGPYFLFHGTLPRAVQVLRPELPAGRVQCVEAYACPRLAELPPAPVLELRVEGFRLVR